MRYQERTLTSSTVRNYSHRQVSDAGLPRQDERQAEDGRAGDDDDDDYHNNDDDIDNDDDHINIINDEQGADTVVWLAISSAAASAPSGRFWQDRAETPAHLPLAWTRSSQAGGIVRKKKA